MREAVLAEWILSLVIAPERASAAIGDLTEEASTRGSLWFWWSVLGTAASHLWQELRLHPGWAIGRGLWALGAMFVYTGSLGMAVFFLRSFVIRDPPSGYPVWQDPLMLVSFLVIFPLVVGWQNARQSPDRELASAIATISTRVSVNLLLASWSAMQMHYIGRPTGLVEDPRFIAAASVCMILGAMFPGRRALRVGACSTH